MSTIDWSEFFRSGSIISLSDGSLMLGWGSRLKSKSPSQSKFSFYFPDFFLKDEKPWLVHEKNERMSLEELEKILEGSPKQKGTFFWRPPPKESFKFFFDELMDLISQKKLLKGVPFIFESGVGKWDPHQLTYSLAKLVKGALKFRSFIYGFWNEEEGMLGLTPETLFSYIPNDLRLFTVACAGTNPSGTSPNGTDPSGTGSNEGTPKDTTTHLLDPKNLHEHELVVQGIRESLHPLGDVNVGSLKLLRLQFLSHLVTPMELKMKNFFSFEEIVQTLHPTPALGAYPRSLGLDWLKHYQTKLDRGRFGAPVGFFDSSLPQVASYVAIRNIQWQKETSKIGAGCGVVQGSVLDQEWDEILLKIRAIKEMVS